MQDLLIQTLKDLVASKDKHISLLEKEIERLKRDLTSKPSIAFPPTPAWNNPPVIPCSPLTHPFVITRTPPCQHQWTTWGDSTLGGKSCALCGNGAGWSQSQ